MFYSNPERVPRENGGTEGRNLHGIGWESFSMRGGGLDKIHGDITVNRPWKTILF